MVALSSEVPFHKPMTRCSFPWIFLCLKPLFSFSPRMFSPLFITSSHLLSHRSSLAPCLLYHVPYLPCYISLHMYLYLSDIPIVRFGGAAESSRWLAGPWLSGARPRSWSLSHLTHPQHQRAKAHVKTAAAGWQRLSKRLRIS